MSEQDIKTTHFDTASEFLETLRRSNVYWKTNRGFAPWVFRGHGDANWSLDATLFRTDFEREAPTRFKLINDGISRKDCECIANVPFCTDDDELISRVRKAICLARLEAWIVNDFVSLVDELGLHVPGGNVHIRHRTIELDQYGDHATPFPSAFGLARHHGVATRLLDWTENPLYAAFFAATGVDSDMNGKMAVWALNLDCLGDQLRTFHVPRSEISFLHAQEGLFTYDQFSDFRFVRNGDRSSLEKLVDRGALRKLTLPRSEAKELEYLLLVERVSLAHLMPTFDNIVKTLKHRIGSLETID